MAYELAKNGANLIITSTKEEDLLPIKSDLEIQYGIKVDTIETKCLDSSIDNILLHKNLNGLIYVAGFNPENDDLSNLNIPLDRIIQVNYRSFVKLILSLENEGMIKNDFSITSIGSVATARARGSNIIYSSSKKALEFFAQSLMHKYSDSSVMIQHYNVGFMQTSMLKNKGLIPAVKPEIVARHIIRNLDKNKIEYYPNFWKIICLILNLVPWFIFKRLRF